MPTHYIRAVAGEREVTIVRCLRCTAPMEWRHGTFQCPRCRFKEGCCEGNTAECYPADVEVAAVRLG